MLCSHFVWFAVGVGVGVGVGGRTWSIQVWIEDLLDVGDEFRMLSGLRSIKKGRRAKILSMSTYCVELSCSILRCRTIVAFTRKSAHWIDMATTGRVGTFRA